MNDENMNTDKSPQINPPNDPSSPTPPTETPRLEPRADGGVGCSAARAETAAPTQSAKISPRGEHPSMRRAVTGGQKTSQQDTQQSQGEARAVSATQPAPDTSASTSSSKSESGGGCSVQRMVRRLSQWTHDKRRAAMAKNMGQCPQRYETLQFLLACFSDSRNLRNSGCVLYLYQVGQKESLGSYCPTILSHLFLMPFLWSVRQIVGIFSWCVGFAKLNG